MCDGPRSVSSRDLSLPGRMILYQLCPLERDPYGICRALYAWVSESMSPEVFPSRDPRVTDRDSSICMIRLPSISPPSRISRNRYPVERLSRVARRTHEAREIPPCDRVTRGVLYFERVIFPHHSFIEKAFFSFLTRSERELRVRSIGQSGRERSSVRQRDTSSPRVG